MCIFEGYKSLSLFPMRIFLSLVPLLLAADACKTAQNSGVTAKELQLKSYYDIQVGGTPQAGASFNIYLELLPEKRDWQLDSLRLRGTTLPLQKTRAAGQYLGVYMQDQPVQPLQDSVAVYLHGNKARGWLRLPAPKLREKIFMPSAAPSN